MTNAIYDQIKTQVMTMAMMDSQRDDRKGSSILTAIWAIILLGIFEEVFRILPTIGSFLLGIAKKYYEKKKPNFIVSMPNQIKTKISNNSTEEQVSLKKTSSEKEISEKVITLGAVAQKASIALRIGLSILLITSIV